MQMGKEVDLIQAVKAGDLVTVQKILRRNSSTNSKKANSSVKLSNLNQQDADGLSVLHHAALVGDHTMMKLLLENGMKVDVKDNKGLRPLHYASWLGKDRIVEMLLHCGSHVNESALDGTTPLHMACEHGHTEVVKKLLVHKGDPTLCNDRCKAPLHLACEFGRKQVVELLLTCEMLLQLRLDSDRDITDNSRTTCLHLAARNGHVDVMELLIEFGFNINQQTPQGTCLHEAAKYGKTDVVRLLLANGIDASRLNSYEETALEIVNKFTATRAAKELKQLLREASSELLARAVRDYLKPQDASHLEFKQGDIIMVVDRFSRNGLWKGYCASAGGHVTHLGYFPSEMVVIIDPSNANRDSGFSTNNSCIGHNFSPTESTDGQLNRLSGQSSESGVSGVSSYQTSSRSPVSCSHDSLENLDDRGFSSSLAANDAPALANLPDPDLLSTWLQNLHLEEYARMFLNAGYDLQTISRMTPEDLTAIGITQPLVRKKLTSEISRLTIPDGIPDFWPKSVKEWLDILHLSEYCDLLSRQGYKEVDSVVGIMWEDLEEIGIRKLGHQKKIMLAVDRLKKVTVSSCPSTSPGELLAPSVMPHLASGLSPVMSFVSQQICSENLNAAYGRTCSPLYDIKRCFNRSGEKVKPPHSPAASSFGTRFNRMMHGANNSNLLQSCCQVCSSSRMRTCENLYSSDIIDPAPPLPFRGITDYSDSMLTKQGVLSSKKEAENADLSCLHSDKYSDGNVAEIQTKDPEMSYGLSGRGYHLATYGTLPRRPLHKAHVTCHFHNKLFDETNALPFGTERLADKPSLASKRMNLGKINAHPFGISGEKQPMCLDSSVPKFCYITDRHRLDAFNLEGESKIYTERNLGQSVIGNYRMHPERSFLSTPTNETMANNCSMMSSISSNHSNDSFGKETPQNFETREGKCDQAPNLPSGTSLISCQNLSSVSLNSSDSSGTFDGSTLPFANEDCGTIKDRPNLLSASSVSAEASGESRDDGNAADDGRNNTSAKDSLKSFASNQHSHHSKDVSNNIKDRILSDMASTSHQSSISNQTNEAVFDDIDGMLLGLTQELDEMLKLRV